MTGSLNIDADGMTGAFYLYPDRCGDWVVWHADDRRGHAELVDLALAACIQAWGRNENLLSRIIAATTSDRYSLKHLLPRGRVIQRNGRVGVCRGDNDPSGVADLVIAEVFGWHNTAVDSIREPEWNYDRAMYDQLCSLLQS